MLLYLPPSKKEFGSVMYNVLLTESRNYVKFPKDTNPREFAARVGTAICLQKNRMERKEAGFPDIKRGVISPQEQSPR